MEVAGGYRKGTQGRTEADLDRTFWITPLPYSHHFIVGTQEPQQPSGAVKLCLDAGRQELVRLTARLDEKAEGLTPSAFSALPQQLTDLDGAA